MAEPTLHLAPHEIPPQRLAYLDSRPLAFEASCFGHKHAFVGQRVNDGYGNLLFFCFQDEPQRGNFVCTDGGESAAQPRRFWSLGDELRVLTESIEHQRWGRYFVLGEALELATETNASGTLFLSSTGLGTFHSHHEGAARFRWSEPCALQMWNLSPEAVLLPVLRAFKDPSSQLGFAFRWAKMPTRARLSLVYPLQKGSYEEWARVCELCALSFAQWEERESDKLHYRVEVRGKAFAFWSPDNGEKDTHIKEGLLHSFALWSHDYFSPTRDDALCARHSCANEWANGAEAIFHLHLERPTQHEHLEARLQLRDWLADKATPNEIESLLAQE